MKVRVHVLLFLQIVALLNLMPALAEVESSKLPWTHPYGDCAHPPVSEHPDGHSLPNRPCGSGLDPEHLGNLTWHEGGHAVPNAICIHLVSAHPDGKCGFTLPCIHPLARCRADESHHIIFYTDDVVIQEAAIAAAQWLRDNGLAGDIGTFIRPLSIYRRDAIGAGDSSDPFWSHYNAFFHSIQIMPTPGKDPVMTLRHEMGHAVIGAGCVQIATEGGSHNVTQDVGAGMAMSEGWADFLELALTYPPTEAAPMAKGLDWEKGRDDPAASMSSALVSSEGVEFIVGSSLWDLYDGVTDRDGHDAGAPISFRNLLGVYSPTWGTLTEGPVIPSLENYMYRLSVNMTGSRAQIDEIRAHNLEFGPPPSITAIEPSAGRLAGGTFVTIRGNNFTPGSLVFLSDPRTASWDSTTDIVVDPGGKEIKVRLPTKYSQEQSAVKISFAVVSSGGPTSFTDGYMFVRPLDLRPNVDPPFGRLAGWSTVRIIGKPNLGDGRFWPLTKVYFNGVEGVVHSGGGVGAELDAINVSFPPSAVAGSCTILVTSPGGDSMLRGAFRYCEPPVIESIYLPAGPVSGGDSLEVRGKNFESVQQVKVDGALCRFDSRIETFGKALKFTMPPHAAGIVQVSLVPSWSLGFDPATVDYEYQDTPRLTSITPESSIAGRVITFSGEHLQNVSRVRFGGIAATFQAVSASQFTATAPNHAPGLVDIEVSTPGGRVTLPSAFLYRPLPPQAISINPDPAVGSMNGGATIQIVGRHFDTPIAVSIGGNIATITVLTPSPNTHPFTGAVTVTTPAGSSLGAHDIVITTAGGSVIMPAAFLYKEGPVIDSVTPATGALAGGTIITIHGKNLDYAESVSVGGTRVSIPNGFGSDGVSGRVVAPVHAEGPVEIKVLTRAGLAALADGFRYVPAPTYTQTENNKGPLSGGTKIRIRGANFYAPATITVGGTAATQSGVAVVAQDLITASVPANTQGWKRIVITVPGGSCSAEGAFEYVPAPTITSLNPVNGPSAGGTSVTLTGTNLEYLASLTVGGETVAFTGVSSTEIRFPVPAHAAGSVAVNISSIGGSAQSNYNYLSEPKITSLSPKAGPLAGGNTVSIYGTNLLLASSVRFKLANQLSGTTASFTQVSSSKITAVAPASSSAGNVEISVTTPTGVAKTNYTYQDAPTISSVSPSSGTASGGTSVVIKGTNLTGATSVLFGAARATIGSVTATAVTVISPAGAKGSKVDISVTTPGGTVKKASAFAYQ